MMQLSRICPLILATHDRAGSELSVDDFYLLEASRRKNK